MLRRHSKPIMTSRWLAGACATAISVLGAGLAYADESVAGANTVEEVTVTAQRRGENEQSVPIGMATMTAEDLSRANISNLADLQQVAPSLTVTQGVGGAGISIRGIGGLGTAGDESANAVYIDGVYQTFLPSLLSALNNIQQVEVLEGPQGTLFGRNSLNGVISITTRDPSQEPSADVSLGYGNYETFQGAFYGTAGITDNLAANLAIYDQTSGEGWGTNFATGKSTYQGQDFEARSKWRWDISESTSLTLIGSFNDTSPASLQGITVLPGYYNKAHVGNVGFYDEDDNLDTSFRTTEEQVSGKLTHDFGWAQLVDIASYDHSSNYNVYDQDASTLNIVSSYFTRPSSTVTEELQLLSPTSSKLTWIVGYYFYNNSQGADPLLIDGLGAAPYTYYNLYTTQTTQSNAGYAQATYPIFEDTDLTVGGRYTWDDHHFVSHEVTNTTSSVPSLLLNQQREDQKFTERYALDHKFSKEVLIYVSYSTGFKSGLYNITSPLNPYVLPETIDATEVGFKTQWFDNRLRLNGDYFYDTLNNIQMRAIEAGATYFYNAAAGRMQGIDLNFEAIPVDNLTINGGLTYLNSIYTSFPNAPYSVVNPAGGLTQTTFNAAGEPFVDAPPFNFNIGASYLLSTSQGDITTSVYLNHSSGYPFDPQDLVRQPYTNLVNASIIWAPSDRWDVKLWSENLTGQRYYAQVNETTLAAVYYAAAPRTYGFTVGAHF